MKLDTVNIERLKVLLENDSDLPQKRIKHLAHKIKFLESTMRIFDMQGRDFEAEYAQWLEKRRRK